MMNLEIQVRKRLTPRGKGKGYLREEEVSGKESQKDMNVKIY